jgi:hypothetical protein
VDRKLFLPHSLEIIVDGSSRLGRDHLEFVTLLSCLISSVDVLRGKRHVEEFSILLLKWLEMRLDINHIELFRVIV